jgi:DNA replication protein DnaC
LKTGYEGDVLFLDFEQNFQVISQRYERGSIVITSNEAFKRWPAIFKNDSTITSAVLDRLLHHAETILIEGSSYRMKDRIFTPLFSTIRSLGTKHDRDACRLSGRQG